MVAKSEKSGMETYFFIIFVRGKGRALSVQCIHISVCMKEVPMSMRLGEPIINVGLSSSSYISYKID